MITVKGKFSEAKVFVDTLDSESYKQILELCNQEISQGSTIRIMPDVHAGKDNVIGLTMTLTPYARVAPSLIGSDIGCGVSLSKFQVDGEIDLKELDELIRENIPYGYLKREKEIISVAHNNYTCHIPKLTCSKTLGVDYLTSIAKTGIGTLGGGNHFIELYKHDDWYYISVHTGSRTLGGVVYKHYQSKAKKYSYIKFIDDRQELIKNLKLCGREQDIQNELANQKQEYLKTHNIDDEIPYLTGDDLRDYIHDISMVQIYADRNRVAIIEEIIGRLPIREYRFISDKPHNYIDRMNLILRKGSQSAEKGETVIIPINMRDGVIVGKAKGLVDWNMSAPHGAGRVLSRGQAKQQLDIEEFREQMKDIYSSTVGEETLDEAPNAYKSINDILESIKESVDIDYILKPIYNFKGGKEFKEYKENNK